MNTEHLANLEATRAYEKLEGILADAAASAEILRFASAYYVRRKLPAKALTYYSRYISTTTPDQQDPGAAAMAIECASRLGQHKTTLDCFLGLTTDARSQLGSKTLTLVCRAFVAERRLSDAEKLLAFMRSQIGGRPLPDFDTYIRDRFGDVTRASAFADEHSKKSTKLQTTGEAIEVALAFMATGKFKEAEMFLEAQKRQLAA
jgi:hypothetical protein